MTALLTTEDTLILDEMLGHDAKCQSAHRGSNAACSVEPTHVFRARCNNDRRLFCHLAARHTLTDLALRLFICEDCGCPSEDCWSVTPA